MPKAQTRKEEFELIPPDGSMPSGIDLEAEELPAEITAGLEVPDYVAEWDKLDELLKTIPGENLLG